MDIVRRAWKHGFTSDPWVSGYGWLGYGVLGGLLPLWGTTFLLWLMSKDIQPYGLLKNGEFVLYAASFVGASLYVIRRDVFPNRKLLSFLFSALLILAALTFAAITVSNLQHTAPKPAVVLHVSEIALIWVSGLVLAVSTFLSLLVVVVDAGGAGFDIPAHLKQDEAKLADAFELLQQRAGDDEGAGKP